MTEIVNENLAGRGRKFTGLGKKQLWIVFALLVGLISFYGFSTPAGLSVEGHRFLALLSGLIILFITEALPLPITMGGAGALIILFGIGETEQVWTSYAHPVVFFVIGCLMLANIAEQVGLTRRLGNFLLKNSSTNVVKFSFTTCLIFGLLSGIMHDVSAVTLGLMTLLPLMRSAEIKPGSRTGKFLLISMAFCCSAGGMSTLAGGGRNMVAAAFIKEFAGVEISFWTWTLHAFLPALFTIPVVWFTVYLFFRPDRSLCFPTKEVEARQLQKTSFTINELLTLIIISFVLIGFLTTGYHGIDYSVLVFLGVLLLAITGVVKWQLLNKEIAWAVALLIFGGGISLGRAMDYTGTAEYLAGLFFPFFDGYGWIVLFIGVGIFGTLFSEIMANVASAALIIPITIPIALRANIDPTVVALSLGMFTSFAYMLVIGCPPNAIAYSFGYFSMSDFFKVGLVTNIVAVVFLAVLSILWWSFLGIIV